MGLLEHIMVGNENRHGGLGRFPNTLVNVVHMALGIRRGIDYLGIRVGECFGKCHGFSTRKTVVLQLLGKRRPQLRRDLTTFTATEA
ncbi:MAG TPA: hypothetical protein VGR26_19430 [Acidimicrobiales bacterium]|nr:hypothetical protein [Acidimicrobiales bacterium]